MVITKDTYLPEYKDLQVEECKLGTSYLLAGAFHLGKQCELENNEFMLCRQELKDPRKCLAEGKVVTACTMNFFRAIKKNCAEEFTDYAVCLDKSSRDYEMKLCRKTQAIFDTCMKEKLGMDRPHIGYHTEARIHESIRPKPEPEKPKYFPGALPQLPDEEIPRARAGRHSGRGVMGS